MSDAQASVAGAEAAQALLKPSAAAAPAPAQQPQRQKLLKPSELSFQTVVDLMCALRTLATYDTSQRHGRKKLNKGEIKKRYLKKFIDDNIVRESGEAFEVFRLMMPYLDTSERGNYRLKEDALIKALLKAAGMVDSDPRAKVIKAYKREAAKGAAGDLAGVLKENLYNGMCGRRAVAGDDRRLKVADVNTYLDRLAAVSKVDDKAAVLREMIGATTPEQMTWLTQIILKDLRVGASEKMFMDAWHLSAFDTFNDTGMNLKAVFEDPRLWDPTRPVQAAISPGKAVRPQLAKVSLSTQAAFKYMQTAEGALREFVVETKFDGERIQVHRCGPEKVCYYSRRAIDHGTHSNYSVMDALIHSRFKHDNCIIDGEMLVWNKAKLGFEPFGILKAVINAAKDGKDPDHVLEVRDVSGNAVAAAALGDEPPAIKDCEIIFVAFDILYAGDELGDVRSRPLRERHALLREAISREGAVPLSTATTVCGCVRALIPGETTFNGKLASRLGFTDADIKEALDTATALKEEGIVVKALDSPWLTNDRGWAGHVNWIKLKPDYLRDLEMDAVIIGGWYGEGKRGGQGMRQYLMGLRDTDGPLGQFASFAKVGTGLSDEEAKRVNDELADNLWGNPGDPPKCYRLAPGYEKPDMWVKNPEKSVTLELHADLRTIPSNKMASGYSLRFPRIVRIRDDKSPAEAGTVAELMEFVEEQRSRVDKEKEGKGVGGYGSAGEAEEESDLAPRKKRRLGARREDAAKRPKIGAVVASLQLADVSMVEKESEALAGCILYFCNYPRDHPKPELEATVKRLGGQVAANLVPRVTHVLADHQDTKVKGAVKRDADVLSIRWLLECAAAARHLPPAPRHYLHLSAKAREAAGGAMDAFGDRFFEDLTPEDVAALISNILPAAATLDAPQIARALAAPEEGWDWEAPAADPRARAAAEAEAKTRLAATLLHRAAPKALALYMDAELPGGRAVTLLRACALALVRLEPPGAAAAAASAPPPTPGLAPAAQRALGLAAEGADALQRLRAARLADTARLHGAEVAPAVGSYTTHLLAVGPAPAGAPQPPCTPAALLAAVAEQAGGAEGVRALRQGLQADRIQLVEPSWLEETARRLQEAGCAAHVPPESAHALHVEGRRDISCWPWAAYGPSPLASPAKGGMAAPGGSPAAPIVCAPRRRGKATSIVAAAPAARVAPAPAAAKAPPAEAPKPKLGPKAAAIKIKASAHASPHGRGGAAAPPPSPGLLKPKPEPEAGDGAGDRKCRRRLQKRAEPEPAAQHAVEPPAPGGLLESLLAGGSTSLPAAAQQLGSAPAPPPAQAPPAPAAPLPPAPAPTAAAPVSLFDELFGSSLPPAALAPAGALAAAEGRQDPSPAPKGSGGGSSGGAPAPSTGGLAPATDVQGAAASVDGLPKLSLRERMRLLAASKAAQGKE